MRTLSLYRHAKSSWDNPGLDDFDRPLNKRGRKAAIAMGEFMKTHDIQPDLILCSPALRARETLERSGQFFAPTTELIIDKSLYLGSPTAILQSLNYAKPHHKHVMVIAHNPGLHLLSMSLMGHGSPKQVEALSEKFPTAALAVFDFENDTWPETDGNPGNLRLFMVPKSLK